ncbi:MAG: hypothetical protein HOV78_05085 [Hamadaea sp.]|nr:hypothetical protein [Hamadaea sp.]
MEAPVITVPVREVEEWIKEAFEAGTKTFVGSTCDVTWRAGDNGLWKPTIRIEVAD